MCLLAQGAKVLLGVASLVLRQFVVICPEELERRCSHEQQPSRSHTSAYLPKNLFMIHDVFEDIEKKNNVPFLAPAEVKQIDLVSRGEGANHWFSQR